jgi:hypothetical protein
MSVFRFMADIQKVAAELTLILCRVTSLFAAGTYRISRAGLIDSLDVKPTGSSVTKGIQNPHTGGLHVLHVSGYQG